MTFAERYPKPPLPPPPEPPPSWVTGFTLATKVKNDYVHASRRHVVALALDELTTRGSLLDLPPADRIVAILGRVYLEGGVGTGGGFFDQLFGGL